MLVRRGIPVIASLLALICGLGVPAHIVLHHALPGALHTHAPHAHAFQPPDQHAHLAAAHEDAAHPEAAATGRDDAHCHRANPREPHRHGFPTPHEHSDDGTHDHEILNHRQVLHRANTPTPVLASSGPPALYTAPRSIARAPEVPVRLASGHAFTTIPYRRGPPRG